MTAWMTMTDTLGPESIFHVYDAKTGLKAVVVVDTTLNHIAGGGTRMMPDITTAEIFGLARAMTHKFAIFDFPIGGAKAGIWADPGLKGEERQALLRAFGKAVKPLLSAGVTLAADIGTDGEDVATLYAGADLPSGSTGLALTEIDGEPLENHATGYGVVEAARAACEMAELDMGTATAAIEGFGKVGTGVARYLKENGTTVVAISTLNGCLYRADGLDVEKLLSLKKTVGDDLVNQYPGAEVLKSQAIYGLPVDILIPGARPYVIDRQNVQQVKARVISSIANIPITDEAEEILFRKNVVTVPDFISNAGGITVALVDILGGNVENVFDALRKLLGPLTREILVESRDQKINPRKLAIQKTTARVLAARDATDDPPFDEILNRVKTRLDL
ncbi:MAG: Glu/Leu/Phe/Val dehydrogenase dimerization domain-containing protein [bacterium]